MVLDLAPEAALAILHAWNKPISRGYVRWARELSCGYRGNERGVL